MAWAISDVARMSRVTSRTLRHYDDIGLLTPAYVGVNGYRFYEQEQLLRLQQILLLRELGLGLDTIAGVLAGDRDRLEALRLHERWLRAEQARLAQLVTTVVRTITQLQGGTSMAAEDLFEGFAEKQAQQEAALAERFGDGVREHFRTSEQRTRGWTRQDYLAAQQLGEALDTRMAALLSAGAPPTSAEVQDLVGDHYASICQYPGLGELYVDDPEFRARYDAVAPGLAEYWRDAITEYAAARLD